MITFARDASPEALDSPTADPAPDRGPESGASRASDPSFVGRSAPQLSPDRYWRLSTLFGVSFVVVGTLLEIGVQGLGFSLGSVFAVQRSTPLLWIIDAAPFVLGAFGWAIAQAQREADRLRASLAEGQVAEEIDRFLKLTSAPLAILGGNGVVVRVSPGFSALLGYSAEELLGTDMMDLVHPDDRPGGRLSRISAALEDGNEVRMRTKDGDHRLLRWSVVPVQEKALTYVLGRDLTDERSRLEELAAARDAAEAGGRAKSEFLANMSHELRTPMNGVIGMTELALETELTAKQRLYLESIDESAKSLMSTIADLLDFSQMEADKLALKNAALTPAKVLEEVLPRAEAAAKDKGLTFMYEEDAGLTWELVGDETRCAQILGELLDNAVKFTSYGEIVVRAGCRTEGPGKAMFEVSIRDTGVGLTEDQAEHIFDAFSQADGSMTRGYGGTGLGLTIASQLAQMMGGTIDVQSALGAGSTFTMQVPMPMARVVSEEPTEGADLAPMGLERRVLLVEDERVNRVLTEAVLKRHGFAVTVAENGEDAVEEVRNSEFDLVLMDIQIPVIDGLEATQLIRELEKDRIRRTPVIALTAHVAKGDRTACFQSDMDDYIPKPVDPVRFEGVIRRHVEGPKSHFEWFRAIALSGGEDALLDRARDFLEVAEGELRVVMDAVHRGDKIALWQAARTLEDEAAKLSLNRLRDTTHHVAVLIGRGRPDEAMELVDDMKQALRDAVAAVRHAVDSP